MSPKEFEQLQLYRQKLEPEKRRTVAIEKLGDEINELIELLRGLKGDLKKQTQMFQP